MKSSQICFLWPVLASILCLLPLVSSDDDCSTAEPFHFELLWVVQLMGTYSGEDLQLALERDVMLSLECESSGGFYEVTNVTLRFDLIDSLFLDPIDSTAIGSATPSQFSIPVSLNVSTNLTALVGVGSIFSLESVEEGDDDRRRLRTRQLQGDCGCSLPTKEGFLRNLTDHLSGDAASDISSVMEIIEIEEVECPAENLTTFTTGVSITVFGYEELVSPEGLASLVTMVMGWWNTLNFYENCDITNARLLSGNASLDTTSSDSSRRLQASPEKDLRQLQDDESSDPPTQSQQPSFAPSAVPSFPPSITASLAPSSAPSNSSSPTGAPVLADPGFFQVIMSFTGSCYGCSNETSFFFRQQTERRLAEDLSSKPSADMFQPVRKLSQFENGDCLCPAGAPEGQGVDQGKMILAINGQLAEEQAGQVANFAEFVTGLQAVNTFPCQRNSFTSFATMVFIGDPDEIDRAQVEALFLRTFNEQADQGCDPLARTLDRVTTLRSVFLDATETPSSSPSTLPSFASMAPSSLPSQVASDSPSSFNATARRNLKGGPNAYNSESLLGTRRLQTGTDTEASSASLQPSTNPPNETSAPLSPSTSTQPSGTMEPTFAPNVSDKPSDTFSNQPSIATDAPTSAPTMSGPDLFYLLFELTGTCNGCESDSSFFDQVIPGMRRSRRALQKGPGKRRPALRYLEEEGICSCDLDAENTGVTVDDFVMEFRSEVVEGDLAGVENVEDVTELETLPPTTTPTESVVPSSNPSEIPSVAPSDLIPSELPSASPSNVASEVPSQVPSEILPSKLPSEEPSSQPSGTDAPFDAPSVSWSPSDVPSLAPSPAPSVLPSHTPSASGAPSGILPTTPSPSQSTNPSFQPSVAPSASSSPSAMPSSAPSPGPSAEPSTSPSDSVYPSRPPSSTPSLSAYPSFQPTASPSSKPTVGQSSSPSTSPSPSSVPSMPPSISSLPSHWPSVTPTRGPTLFPTRMPSCDDGIPWTCFEDFISPGQIADEVGFAFEYESETADPICPSGESGSPTYVRVEHDGGMQDMTLLVPCCSEGFLEVTQRCVDGPKIVFHYTADDVNGMIADVNFGTAESGTPLVSTLCNNDEIGFGLLKQVGRITNIPAGIPLFIRRAEAPTIHECPRAASESPSLPAAPSPSPTTPDPTPSPTCLAPANWKCFTTPPIDPNLIVDHEGGPIVCPPGESPVAAFKRIQSREAGDVTVSIPCCSRGRYRAAVGCQPINEEIYSRGCNRVTDPALDVTNLPTTFLLANQPFFANFMPSSVLCPWDVCPASPEIAIDDAMAGTTFFTLGYQFVVENTDIPNAAITPFTCHTIQRDPITCRKYSLDFASNSELKIVVTKGSGTAAAAARIQVIDNNDDCIAEGASDNDFDVVFDVEALTTYTLLFFSLPPAP